MNLDEMFGGSDSPPQRRRGRPTKEMVAERERQQAGDLERQRAIRAAAIGVTAINAREFFMPVGQNFLAQVLDLNPETVRRRLRRVQPVGHGDGHQKRPVYDFRKVLPYLIKSEMDAATLLETINPNDLPPSINKTIWEAKRIKLKYEIEAGQAWATEDVLEVFGTVFMAIKDRTKLWVDDLREQCKGMTGPEVLDALQEHIDAYQAALHSDLIEIPKRRATQSKFAEAELAAMPMLDDEDDGE